MKRIFSALVAALCVMLSARAQDTDAHIYGHVIDKATGEHLPYIVVMLKGTTMGVTTENTGHYMMRDIPEGNFTVEVSAIGYKTQTRELNVRRGRSYEVNFVLEEDLVQIDGVIVSATRSETTIGQTLLQWLRGSRSSRESGSRTIVRTAVSSRSGSMAWTDSIPRSSLIPVRFSAH